MKTKLAFLSLILLMALSFTSCKKKKTEEPQPSPKEILTEAMWNYEKIEQYDTNGNLTWSDNPNSPFEFTVSNHYYYYDSQGSLLDSGTYQLEEVSDNLYIIITRSGGGTPVRYEITNLNRNEMKWRGEFSNSVFILYFNR